MNALAKLWNTGCGARRPTVPFRVQHSACRAQQGFTLVELIIVIVISGILATGLSNFIVQPIQGYTDLARRATLVNAADNALRRMARDVHSALPNSIRVGIGGSALEMINVVDGGRYRDDPPPGDPDKRLEFNKADTDFNLLGQFTSIARPFVYTNQRLVIYNVGVAGADAYETGSTVITPSGTSISIAADGSFPAAGAEDHITLTPGFQFQYPSPTQRIYLVDTPISYVCSGGNLYRYTGYPIAKTQLITDAALSGAGASRALVANQVNKCTFTYTPGTSQRAGLLSLALKLSQTLPDATTEDVQLLHQVHVDNTP